MSTPREGRATGILENIIYATVATTCADGKPWNSPVRHVFDDKLNIYWASDANGQHSRNLRNNPDVFIVIYDSTVREGDGEGLYLQAKAHELTDPADISFACGLKKGPYADPPEAFAGDAARRLYKAVPQRAWMNTAEEVAGVFVRDYRVELNLQAFPW